MNEIIRKQSNGLLQMWTFEKTNGQKSLVNGVEVYTMDAEATVSVLQDCAMTGFTLAGWDGTFKAVPAQKNATTLDRFNPNGGAYAQNKQLAKGAFQKFTVQLIFDLTEQGWRSNGIIAPSVPDEKKMRELLVGEWKFDQHTDTFAADGSWTRDGKKLGKWTYNGDGDLRLMDVTTSSQANADFDSEILGIDSTRLVTTSFGETRTRVRVSSK